MSTENKQPDERAAFEVWAREEFRDDADDPCKRGQCGYLELTVDWAWIGWQARATTQQANKGDERAANVPPADLDCANTPHPVAGSAGQAPIESSPAFALRGLYKPAMEYFVDGNPVTPAEYIAWQATIIEAVTKAKLPDPKYYGGSHDEGDQHDVKCAYVDGWNDCRSSILAAPTAPSLTTDAGVAPQAVTLSDEQREAIELALGLIGLSGDSRVRNIHKTLRALLAARKGDSQ